MIFVPGVEPITTRYAMLRGECKELEHGSPNIAATIESPGSTLPSALPSGRRTEFRLSTAAAR